MDKFANEFANVFSDFRTILTTFDNEYKTKVVNLNIEDNMVKSIKKINKLDLSDAKVIGFLRNTFRYIMKICDNNSILNDFDNYILANPKKFTLYYRSARMKSGTIIIDKSKENTIELELGDLFNNFMKIKTVVPDYKYFKTFYNKFMKLFYLCIKLSYDESEVDKYSIIDKLFEEKEKEEEEQKLKEEQEEQDEQILGLNQIKDQIPNIMGAVSSFIPGVDKMMEDSGIDITKILEATFKIIGDKKTSNSFSNIMNQPENDSNEPLNILNMLNSITGVFKDEELINTITNTIKETGLVPQDADLKGINLQDVLSNSISSEINQASKSYQIEEPKEIEEIVVVDDDDEEEPSFN